MSAATTATVKTEHHSAAVTAENDQISSTVEETLHDDDVIKRTPHDDDVTTRTSPASCTTSVSNTANGSAHFSARSSKIRTRIEDRTMNLSNSWNELYTLLAEYKSELYSQEALSEKYENVTELSILKSDLLEKDNELCEKDNEIGNLHEQLDRLQRQYEQSQMDLAVKNNLLKKYQQDLLEKDAALMTSSTKMRRMENKLRALEASSGESSMGTPPRKMARTVVRMGPKSSGRTQSGRASLMKSGSTSSAPTKRHSLSNTKVSNDNSDAHHSSSSVLYLEPVDDLETTPSVHEALEQKPVSMESVYSGGWIEPLHPGDEEPEPVVEQYTESYMDESESHSMEEGAWQMAPQSEDGQSEPPAASNTKATTPGGGHLCTICNKHFCDAYRLRRHLRSFHLHIRPYACEICQHDFAHKYHAVRHIKSKHGIVANMAKQYVVKRGVFPEDQADTDKSAVEDSLFIESVASSTMESGMEASALEAGDVTLDGEAGFTVEALTSSELETLKYNLGSIDMDLDATGTSATGDARFEAGATAAT